MDSLWTKTQTMPQFEPLQKNVDTDVLVVGGGMAGILCAWQLKQAGVDCVLVEQDRLCGGITKNTTAKITLQHGLIYHKLNDKLALLKKRKYSKFTQKQENFTIIVDGCRVALKRRRLSTRR